MPSPQTVRELFEGLFGRDVHVSAASVDVGRNDHFTARYINREGTVVATCVCDVAAAATLAAALTLIPRGRVDEAIDTGRLDEVLMENLREVLNISVALVNTGLEHGLSLGEVLAPGGAPTGAPSKGTQAVSLKIDVNGYDRSGHLTFESMPTLVL